MLTIQVIIGSTRSGRFSEKPAHYIYDELQKQQSITAELIDLRDWPLPFFDEPASPRMAKGTYTNPLGKKWAAKVGEADGYIIVTPEYNHGYPAVLKNALDWAFYEWNKKPVGFVSYGSVGGARVIEQLRQVVIELQMIPLHGAIHIPADLFMMLMPEKMPIDADLFKPLREGRRGDLVEPFFSELLELAKTLQYLRTGTK
ncbi:MAG TPA: NAD(P)H-dependent oxidoreductase [Candidatus Saccharimonadales bacterium]|nr:NAD(P)H-dependent oxidoreductase [Candidatus Saccharimonadales bacterium]